MDEPLRVQDQGTVLTFGIADLLRYHGPGFPGGVAHAFKVMELALPLLADGAPPERRQVVIRTPFPGPGARDAFEMVTRAVTEGRYTVDPALVQSQRGPVMQRYYFVLSHRGREVTVQIRPGHVREEFLALGAKPDRSPAEEERLTYLKQEMADRLLALPADQIYEVVRTVG